jgi:hypothetical protein
MCSIRVASPADGVKNTCSGLSLPWPDYAAMHPAWRDLSRSTRLVFWSGLVAAAAALALLVFFLWAVSQIGG